MSWIEILGLIVFWIIAVFVAVKYGHHFRYRNRNYNDSYYTDIKKRKGNRY